MRTRTPAALVGALTATALALAGCTAQDGGAIDTAPRDITPVRGCGEKSWTPPSDLAEDRTPARCEPGAPAPRPLKKKRKLTIATGTLSAEYVGPLRIALAEGEFAKEGLDVDLKVLPTPEALPLLAKGEIDALWAAPEAAVVNGINGGFDIRWVAGNFSPDPSSKSGLWVRLKKGEQRGSGAAESVNLKGRKIGTMIGKGSVIAYPMDSIFARHRASMDSVTFQQLGSADVLTALTSGGADSAWLLDPVWRKVDGNKRYAFLGGQPVGEPLGGALYGPNLLSEDVDAGVALLRAYIRTINTHFAGDYKKNPEFVAQLSKALRQDTRTLTSVPSLRMDWEIRKGTTDRLQRAYRDAGVTKGPPLPEERLVDRRLYAEAVGHKL
ncbi:ABC transporter substrate-binding protein [Streptomyces sp. HNM0574]|uniref:ABC transporter substrate-binding protein n=1 Tax=Streptomyces sp. HNM0574 TaxID=2714954 RepID=UPI00146DF94B|nr:ABC transporter substrate-binding protein [Streptomyces sp. HNM0574]NLU67250.1 ABC transporter substrate-binding protein [Streptomyces sp. HNM0574]